MFHFDLFRANLEACIGPIPISSGLQPITAPDIILAIGFKSYSFAKFSLQIIMNDAPSVSGDAVAAVIEVFSPNTGDNFDIDSKLDFSLIHPSSITSIPEHDIGRMAFSK